MKQRILILLLALSLIPVLTACSQSAGDANVNTADSGFPALEAMADAEFIEMNGDRLSTVKKVIGERTLINLSTYSSYPDSVMTVTYNYSCDQGDSAQVAGDIEQFTTYLAEREGYTKKNVPEDSGEGSQTEQVWSKASVEASKEIIVSLVSYEGGYTISITKMGAQSSLTEGAGEEGEVQDEGSEE